MQKISTHKALFFLTLLFVLIAVASFAAFHETEQVSREAQCCLRLKAPAPGGEMLWELVSRKFLMMLSI